MECIKLSKKIDRTYLKCQKCGDEFLQKRPWNDEKYCSKKCWSGRKGKTELKCMWCKTIFHSYRENQKYCGMECRNSSYIGKKASQETKNKMSKAKKGYMPVNIFKSGSEHPMWIKDRTKVNPRWSAEYREWRRRVFERDKVCVKCGENGELHTLDADHIVPFRFDQNKIFDVDNGRVLCRPCHMKEPTWGMKTIKRFEEYTGDTAERIS
jgi:hypothetical protein